MRFKKSEESSVHVKAGFIKIEQDKYMEADEISD